MSERNYSGWLDGFKKNIYIKIGGGGGGGLLDVSDAQ